MGIAIVVRVVVCYYQRIVAYSLPILSIYNLETRSSCVVTR